jgi:hypothetical protein
VRAALEDRPLNLQVAVDVQRLGKVDHQKIVQQQFGQRVLAPLAQRPVGLTVQRIVERQVCI